MKLKHMLRICIISVLISMLIAIPLSNFTEDFSRIFIIETYSMLTGYEEPEKIYDHNGVPFFDYKGSIGIQRNAVTVSQTAFDYENEYFKGNKSCRKLLLNCADCLVDTAKIYDNYSLWEANFKFSYNMTPPWRSGMAQGQGIQTLAKAYNISKDKKYLDAGSLALNSFYLDEDKGGVASKEENGWWYEEYADENGSHPRVLNGMVFALLGLHEYYLITGDRRAGFLFDKGIIALKQNIHVYDAGWWTYYDSLGHISSDEYHHIHVDQMNQLYNITGDPLFKKYYYIWKGYEDNPSPFSFFNRLVHNPNKLSVAIYILNIIILISLEFLTLALFLNLKKKKLNSLHTDQR